MLIATKHRQLDIFMFRQAPPTANKDKFKGGGLSFITFTFQNLWEWHHRDWNLWTQMTDGFNLARIKYMNFKFYRHATISYIVYPQQEFCRTNARGYGFFHPSKLLQETKHILVLSRQKSPNTSNYVKKRLKPPATMTNEWYLMHSLAKVPLVNFFITLCDIGNPYTTEKPDQPDASLQLDLIVFKKSNNSWMSHNWSYWWMWDEGKFNGYIWFDNAAQYPTQSYADALGKGVPYYISFFGLQDDTNPTKFLAIWAPDNSMNQDTGRSWIKLTVGQARQIALQGPYVLKNLDIALGLNCSYKIKFQFGGPSITEGYVAGTDPSLLPPGCADNQQFRLQTLDLADYSRGVLNNWDIRRGLITASGLAKITSTGPFLSTEELLRRYWQEETGPEPSDIETLSEESESEESPRKKKKKKKHRHSI